MIIFAQQFLHRVFNLTFGEDGTRLRCDSIEGSIGSITMRYTDAGDQFILMLPQQKWLEYFFSLYYSAMPCLGAFKLSMDSLLTVSSFCDQLQSYFICSFYGQTAFHSFIIY